MIVVYGEKNAEDEKIVRAESGEVTVYFPGRSPLTITIDKDELLETLDRNKDLSCDQGVAFAALRSDSEHVYVWWGNETMRLNRGQVRAMFS